jgi:hypothetical protein
MLYLTPDSTCPLFIPQNRQSHLYPYITCSSFYFCFPIPQKLINIDLYQSDQAPFPLNFVKPIPHQHPNLMNRDDILWKSILEDIFGDFLKFFFADAEKVFDIEKGFVFLDKE